MLNKGKNKLIRNVVREIKLVNNFNYYGDNEKIIASVNLLVYLY